MCDIWPQFKVLNDIDYLNEKCFLFFKPFFYLFVQSWRFNRDLYIDALTCHDSYQAFKTPVNSILTFFNKT